VKYKDLYYLFQTADEIWADNSAEIGTDETTWIEIELSDFEIGQAVYIELDNTNITALSIYRDDEDTPMMQLTEEIPTSIELKVKFTSKFKVTATASAATTNVIKVKYRKAELR